MAKKFEAPKSAYSAVIQSAEATPRTQQAKPECYRFNLRCPIEYKDYLQEMAWRNRVDITAYLNRLIAADMEAHPDWRESLDELNGSR